jgi:FkbM family methyltransferase
MTGRFRRWLVDAYHAPDSRRLDRVLARVIGARLLFVRSAYGVNLFETPGDRTFELCVAGYGRIVAEAVEARNADFVFLDIGANLGLFSLLAARNPHCRKVVAIEPIPQTFANLRANVLRSRRKTIVAVNGAVTDVTDPVVHLAYSPTHSGMARIVGKRKGAVAASVIGAGKLDELVRRLDLPILVKIDVEGAEIEVLKTLMGTTFFPLIDEIVIEVSERNLGAGRRDRLLEILTGCGFAEIGRGGEPKHYDARYGRAVTGA